MLRLVHLANIQGTDAAKAVERLQCGDGGALRNTLYIGLWMWQGAVHYGVVMYCSDEAIFI